MTDKNVTEIAEFENINITEQELPSVISEQFNSILETDKRIQEAEEKVTKAKEIANRQVVAKAMNQKDAINATQDAVRSLAEAQTTLSEAQKLLLDNQQKMADGMRYLLVLGASSIAMNRVVIAELQAKLQKATKEELSQKSREELIGVIKLLREQESAFSKQDRMAEEIKSHSVELKAIHQIDEIQNENDKKHDRLIAENAFKNSEQDKRLQERVKKDFEQDFELQRQQKIDAEHDKKIKQAKIIAWCGVALSIISLAVSVANMFM